MEKKTEKKKAKKSPWANPAYRKMMIKKQKAVGLRSYGSKLTYKRVVTTTASGLM